MDSNNKQHFYEIAQYQVVNSPFCWMLKLCAVRFLFRTFALESCLSDLPELPSVRAVPGDVST